MGQDKGGWERGVGGGRERVGGWDIFIFFHEGLVCPASGPGFSALCGAFWAHWPMSNTPPKVL